MSDFDEITERMRRFPQIIQKMLSLQVKAAGILTVLVAVIFGKHAGVSALIGSVSVIFGVLLASKIAHKTALSKEPAAIIINVLKAEAVKIFVVLVSLWSAFKFYTALVPFALIAGLVLSAIISGASITKLNEDQ